MKKVGGTVLLLVATTLVVIGLLAAHERPACGQVWAAGFQSFDSGTGDCVDGTKNCRPWY